MKLFFRGSIIFIGLVLLWQSIVSLFQLPPFILPTPIDVFYAGYYNLDILANEAWPTIIETVLGLIIGLLFGCMTAILMASCRSLKLWLLPILIISQAIPTFAIAPLLVVWFGYGITSKIITTVIMLFFPITSAFFDGLQRTELGWLDLAKTMQSKKWRIYWHIRIPAALPHLASGLRVAAVIAPIGAVVGEWVGSSQGLGYLMLNANARTQIDLMFAALFSIIIFSLLLYFVIDQLLKKFIFWEKVV